MQLYGSRIKAKNGLQRVRTSTGLQPEVVHIPRFFQGYSEFESAEVCVVAIGFQAQAKGSISCSHSVKTSPKEVAIVCILGILEFLVEVITIYANPRARV